MNVATVLSGKGREVATVPVNATLRDVVAELARRKIGALVVVDGESVAGVISERDLVSCLHEQGESLLERGVAEVMTSPAITVEPGTPVLTALALITARRVRHLPVVVNGRLEGLVSIGDLVKYRIDHIEREAEAMRAYIQSA